jgi:hypothetical protein
METTSMDTSLPGAPVAAPVEAAYPYAPEGPSIMATPPVTAPAETAPVEAARPYVPPGAPPIMTNQITLFPHNPIPLFEEPPEDKILIDPNDIPKDEMDEDSSPHGMDEDSSPPSAAASFTAPPAAPGAPSGMVTDGGGNRDRDLIIKKKKNKTKKGKRKKHKTKRDKIKKSKTRKNKIKKRKTKRNKNKNN